MPLRNAERKCDARACDRIDSAGETIGPGGRVQSRGCRPVARLFMEVNTAHYNVNVLGAILTVQEAPSEGWTFSISFMHAHIGRAL